ncbi:MAG: DUF1176 domain-containing protein [Devosia sp.]|nr:DUF1176 domain-containing protein [Devosia sp.]
MIRPLLWLPLAALSLAPTLAQAATLKDQALALHALAGGEWCDGPTSEWAPDDAYEEWELSYQPSWNDGADKETATLLQLFCMSGAYNVTYSYYLYTDLEGLKPIGFATPHYDVRYENDDSEGAVEEMTITGMGAEMTLVNPQFDPETMTLTSYSKWRGLGDASSAGTWVFVDGAFSLRHFEVDASYDGEINPEILLDYSQK